MFRTPLDCRLHDNLGLRWFLLVVQVLDGIRIMVKDNSPFLPRNLNKVNVYSTDLQQREE